MMIETLQRRKLPPPELARAIRKAAGATQAEVAAEVRVHQSTVARWESGRRRPRADEAERYAAVLDLLRDVAS